MERETRGICSPTDVPRLPEKEQLVRSETPNPARLAPTSGQVFRVDGGIQESVLRIEHHYLPYLR